MQRKKPVTVASSEEIAVRLDETQYGAGDGPCLTAIRDEAAAHIPDMNCERRWPESTAAALVAGVGSSWAVPLLLEGEAEAGLNMYSTRSHGFTTGAIMAQNRCSQETAMKILKIASSTRNVKLRDIAASVIASVANDPKVRTHFEP